ncbi:MAG: class I SAM-dependent methyltransferase [Flammeovirgaceae bacterium]|nr:MAG: class I SAM-dependent methyltransferase [Flammeovirgaceae bacterium]
MPTSFLQPSWVKSTKSTRFQQLKKFFNGKDVLDIGCAVGYQKDDWMHKNIVSVARSVYGLDLDNDSVEEIRRMGYAVCQGNAQNFSLDRKFNLIHAGELIEHLDNPGGFLESVKEHLTEDGVLLITTPNALRVSNFIYAATGGLKVNVEHTCWFCETTIATLLERKGFEVVEVGYLKHETFNWLRRMLLSLRALLLPDRVAWNTLYVVAKIKAF